MERSARLVAIFRDHAERSATKDGAGPIVPTGDGRELAQRIDELIAKGQNAWPGVGVPPEAFVAHLAERAAATNDALVFLASVHAEDLYLACALCQGDRAALDHFESRFMSKVQQYVARLSVDRDLVDEVKQVLRERLLLSLEGRPKIADYSGKGALGGWLRIAAVRTTLNALRGRSTHSNDEPDEEVNLALDPELAYVKARAQDLFRDAFTRALASQDVNGRAILRLHYVEGLSMEKLGQMYRTPRSTIARRVDEVRQSILLETERLLAQEQRLSASEVVSLIRSASSQIHLTLTKLLK